MEYYEYFINNTLDYNDINSNILSQFISDSNVNTNQLLPKEIQTLLIKIDKCDIKLNFRLQLLKYSIDKDFKSNFVSFYYQNDPSQILENMKILKLFYPNIKDFAKDFKFIFNENYFNQSIMYQKAMIYYFYFMTTKIYDRGSDHKYYYKVLYKVFKQFIQLKNEEMIFYIYAPLLLTHNGVTTAQQKFKKFNQLIELKVEKFIKQTIIPKYDIKKVKFNKNTNKIAFIIESSTWHSINSVFYSLLQNLYKHDHGDYKYIILNMEALEFGAVNEETVTGFKSLGYEYYNLHEITNSDNNPFYNQTEKALTVREFIISKKIDTLISVASWHPINTFLFTTRTCKKQIYWSHGNSMFDINGIDKRISHFNQTVNKYKFNIFNIPTDTSRYNIVEDKEKTQEIKNRFPKDTFILGVIGRLIKINDKKYLEVVAKIMKKNKNTVFLACGSGEQEEIRKKVNKLGIGDRFYFEGHIDPHVYGYTIDLYLSPFFQGGGEASMEYRSKGKVCISKVKKAWIIENLKINFQETYANNNTEYILKSLYSDNDLQFIANHNCLIKENKIARFYQDISAVSTKKEYIAITDKLINNEVLRNKAGKETLFCMQNHTQSTSFIEVIMNNK